MASAVTITEISPAGTAHHAATVSLTEIAPAGVAYYLTTVSITEISPAGVRHYSGTVSISEISVQLGDFPGVEGRVRYYADGRWVPSTAEHWWSVDRWIPA